MSTTRETVSDLPRDLIARSLFCSLVLADNPITKILARLDSGNVTDSHTYFRLNWPIFFFRTCFSGYLDYSSSCFEYIPSYNIVPRCASANDQPFIPFFLSIIFTYLFILFIIHFVIIYSSNKYIKWNDCFSMIIFFLRFPNVSSPSIFYKRDYSQVKEIILRSRRIRHLGSRFPMELSFRALPRDPLIKPSKNPSRSASSNVPIKRAKLRCLRN